MSNFQVPIFKFQVPIFKFHIEGELWGNLGISAVEVLVLTTIPPAYQRILVDDEGFFRADVHGSWNLDIGTWNLELVDPTERRQRRVLAPDGEARGQAEVHAELRGNEVRPVSLRTTVTIGVIALTVWAAAPAAAQQARRVDYGEWIRLSTRDAGRDPEWIVGAFAASTSLYVVVEPLAAEPLAIPHLSLTRLEVQRGWSSRARQAGLAGGVTGLAASLALGLWADCFPACLVIGAPVGASIGAVIGARHVRMRWESISPALVRPNVQARVSPLRFAITLAF